MSFLPGMFPFIVDAVYNPSSYVFNGTDEYFSRTFATSSPNVYTYTISIWAKHVAFHNDTYQSALVNSYVDDNNLTQHDTITLDPPANLFFRNIIANANTSQQYATTTNLATGVWYHYVFRIDTTAGTAENRVQIYLNGNLETDNDDVATIFNQNTNMFVNGSIMLLGAIQGINHFNGRLAFIDVAYGQSLPPTDFAFNNSSVWTRKKFAGSYGTYGFSLDGTSYNDVSGNGLNFTPTNMDNSNLNTADLPPYTN